MNLHQKISALKQLYDIYDNFVDGLDLACRKSCADCCTRNVTATSLEAYLTAEHIISAGETALLERTAAAKPLDRFQPRFTTNQFALTCVRGEDAPEEEIDPAWRPCPLLTDNECPVYAVRPFGCRAMSSRRVCGETGFADTDDFTLTVNNVMLQYLEHVDADGFSGNLIDMMLYFSSESGRTAYEAGQTGTPGPWAIPNLPLQVLMVPPEHRERIGPILSAIQNIRP